MAEIETSFNKELIEYLTVVAREGIRNAADGFGGMLGEKPLVKASSTRMVSLKDLASMLDSPETEAVGIYLRIEGELAGQMMLIISHQKALELADLMMDQPKGTCTTLGRLERSALAEMGNLTGSFFLNSLHNISRLSARPSPPAVMVDMLGAILDIVIATTGGFSEELMLMEAEFYYKERQVEANFWVIPDPVTLDVINEVVKKNG